jgi:hypothetical protein
MEVRRPAEPWLFFELYDLLYSGYVASGLIKSGILTPCRPWPLRHQRAGELHCVRSFAVACGHSYDAQIKSPFERVSSEKGRLDMFIARVHSLAYFLTKSRARMTAESNVRSLARALARRDITVPAGQSKIVAIS